MAKKHVVKFEIDEELHLRFKREIEEKKKEIEAKRISQEEVMLIIILNYYREKRLRLSRDRDMARDRGYGMER